MCLSGFHFVKMVIIPICIHIHSNGLVCCHAVPPRQAWPVLERYHLELLNFLTRQVNCRHTAADMAQDCYLRVMTAQSAGMSVLNARALLYRTARNLIIDLHRRNQVRRHEELDALPEEQHPAAPQHLQPDEQLASRQAIEAYARTIESLPQRCREAFELHVHEGFSHAEIARHMGISVSMVEKHLVRAMSACRHCQWRLRHVAGVPDAEPMQRPRAHTGQCVTWQA